MALGNSMFRHDTGEAVNTGDSVANLKHCPDFADVDLTVELLDLLLQDRSDFVTTEFHGSVRWMIRERRFTGGDECFSLVSLLFEARNSFGSLGFAAKRTQF